MVTDRSWAARALLIANPRAGARDRQRIDQVVAHCEGLVPHLEVVHTEYQGHAEERAARAAASHTEAVIVLGGDGTTREVASGLARSGLKQPGGRRPAMVNIPFGTGNSFYQEIWGDAPWRQVLDQALSGEHPHLRWVDMAHILEIDVLALLGAGAGLVADALEAAHGMFEIPGRDRYQQAVAQIMGTYTPYEGRVSVDGRVVHEGPVALVNIGGGRYRAGRFKLLPHSVIDDGLLDVCVVGGPMGVRELAGLTRDGSHIGRPGVVYERGSRFVVERTDGRQLSFEHDGELCTGEASRYTIDVLPAVLPVLAPPAPMQGSPRVSSFAEHAEGVV
ncbi:diacylglycerol kinase family protein [Streptomyces sp. ISL-111]|uniref:diacylglycerol/lipid kinase family protein n=1 Tax=unclassified Streptomyces TaxID=2593676 RepID=UPI001BE9FA33|nr:diacylglycerol kinase family protein [Streptomyces sp. ISL-111]MBT2381578.1 diacylglycerol kinase [Streptomyces sp. ISL-111]